MKPTRESQIESLREAYASDSLSIERLERATEHVLRGGYVDSARRLRSPIMDRVRARRKCDANGHEWLDVTALGDALSSSICRRCGETCVEGDVPAGRIVLSR